MSTSHKLFRDLQHAAAEDLLTAGLQIDTTSIVDDSWCQFLANNASAVCSRPTTSFSKPVTDRHDIVYSIVRSYGSHEIAWNTTIR